MESFTRTLNYLANVKARNIRKIVRIVFEKFSHPPAHGLQACANSGEVCAERWSTRKAGVLQLDAAGAHFAQLNNAGLNCRGVVVFGHAEAQVPSPCVRAMRPLDRSRDECEASHTPDAARALLLRAAGGRLSGIAAMSMRRMIYWWFRFVMSGRFLDRFLTLPHAPE